MVTIDGIIWNKKVACWILFGLAQLFGIIGFIILVVVISKYEEIPYVTKKNTVHPLLMFIGLVYLQGTAISGFRVLNDVEKLYVKYAHACIHTIIFVLNIVGLVAIFNYQNDIHGRNLVSFHGYLGLITVILFSAQWVYSFLVFLYPKASGNWRETLMPYHRACGVLSFTLAVINALLRLQYLDAGQSDAAGVLCPLFTLLFGILIIILVTKNIFKRENIYD